MKRTHTAEGTNKKARKYDAWQMMTSVVCCYDQLFLLNKFSLHISSFSDTQLGLLVVPCQSMFSKGPLTLTTETNNRAVLSLLDVMLGDCCHTTNTHAHTNKMLPCPTWHSLLGNISFCVSVHTRVRGLWQRGLKHSRTMNTNLCIPNLFCLPFSFSALVWKTLQQQHSHHVFLSVSSVTQRL